MATQNVEAVCGGQGNTAKNREQNNRTAEVKNEGMLQSYWLSFGYISELGELSYTI